MVPRLRRRPVYLISRNKHSEFKKEHMVEMLDRPCAVQKQSNAVSLCIWNLGRCPGALTCGAKQVRGTNRVEGSGGLE